MDTAGKQFKEKFLYIDEKIQRFFYSRWFLLVLGIFIFIVQTFGLDMFGFGVLATVVGYMCLFSKNTNRILPVVCMAVFCVSIKNSPMYPASAFVYIGKLQYTVTSTSTYYSSPAFLIFVIIGVTLLGGALVYRLVRFGDFKKVFCKRGLVWAMLALAIPFMFNGVFASTWQTTDLLMGLIQTGTYLFLYVVLASTMDYDTFTLEDLADIMLTVMFYVLALVTYIYATRYLAFMSMNNIWKYYLVCGWGISNSMGSMIAITMPACLYKIAKSKSNQWFWYMMLVVAFAGVYFTLCRTALLASAVMVMLGIILGLAKQKHRKATLLTLLITCLVVILLIAVLIITGTYQYFFDYFLKHAENDPSSGRLTMWGRYAQYFLKYPIFGGGFSVDAEAYSQQFGGVYNFYSTLAHNVVFQMLGSCGLVGMIGLVVHLICVIKTSLKDYDANRNFLIIGIIVFFITAMLDIIFFASYYSFIYIIELIALEADISRKAKIHHDTVNTPLNKEVKDRS